MYGYLRKAFLITLVLLFSAVFLFGESYSSSTTFHVQVYNKLRSDRFNPERQPLQKSSSTQFPYNVILRASNPDSKLSIITDSNFAYNHISLIEDLSRYAEIAGLNLMQEHMTNSLHCS